jgi:hypothetical protein
MRSLVDEDASGNTLLLVSNNSNDGMKEKEAYNPRFSMAKQPSECQVVSESCEWCLVPTPWSDDEPDAMQVVGSPVFFLAPPPKMRKGKNMSASQSTSAPSAPIMSNSMDETDKN